MKIDGFAGKRGDRVRRSRTDVEQVRFVPTPIPISLAVLTPEMQLVVPRDTHQPI